MRARVKKTTPLVCAAICFALVFSVPFIPGFDVTGTGNWLALAWFFLVGLVFVWAAFRKTPELEISAEHVSIRGSDFERSNIRYARVFRACDDGDVSRYIEIQFKEMPRLSLGWKFARVFERFQFPKKCERGIALAREPRIVAVLNSTDLSDDELNRELSNSEHGDHHRQPYD